MRRLPPSRSSDVDSPCEAHRPGSQRPASAGSAICSAIDGSGADLPRVLLVGNNPVNRLLAGRLLASLGIETAFADEAGTAFLHTGEHPPDVILLDCHLPDQAADSVSLLEKSIEGAGRPFIVGWTSDAEGCEADYLASGMDEILPKPLALPDLQCLLTAWRRWRASAARWGNDARGASDSLTPNEASVVTQVRQLLGAAFAGVLDTYLSQTVARLAEIENGLTQQNLYEVSRVAHALAGSSASIGALALSRLCHRLERESRDTSARDLRPLLDAARAEFARFRRGVDLNFDAAS